MAQLVTSEVNSSIIEVDVDGHPGVKAYAAGDGRAHLPSEATLEKFQARVEEAQAGLTGDADDIRQMFADGNTSMLLRHAKSQNRSAEECSEILNSLEGGFVDEIRIVEGDKILVSLQEGDWTV
tara:strand:+ start:381 stop:752 length:372 start_codon:yes stop_codon:yes gene_type:complete